MRGTRAYLGALGAGLSLAVAASIVLLVVSSVVAFRGWPDDVSPSADPAGAVLAARSSSAASSTSGLDRRASFSLPAARRAGHGARRARAHGAASTGRRGRPREDGGTSATPATSTSEPASSSASGSAGPGLPSARSTVTGVTDAAAGTLKKATDTAAGAVAPVAPTVAGALSQIGAAGAGTVKGTGEAAGKAVDGLLKP